MRITKKYVNSYIDRLNTALNRPKMGANSLYLKFLGGGVCSIYEIQPEGGKLDFDRDLASIRVNTWYTASLKEVLAYIEGLLDYNRRTL